MGGIRIERTRATHDGDTRPAAIEPRRVAGRRCVSSSPLIATAVIALRPRERRHARRRPGAVHDRAAGEHVVWRSERLEAPAPPPRWRCLLMAGTSCSSPAPRPRTRSGCDRSPPWPRRPIPGTEGGTFPFWSPDSRFIGFFADGKLKKVPIAGGPPIVLCDAPGGRGGSWSRDNVILFAPGVARRRPPCACRAPAGRRPPSRPSIRRPAKPTTGGRTFCPMAGTSSTPHRPGPAVRRAKPCDRSESARSTRAKPPSRFFRPSHRCRTASGHLLFARDETLMAQPFDPDARQLKGDAFPLAEHVSSGGKPLRRRVGVGEWHAGVRAMAAYWRRSS